MNRLMMKNKRYTYDEFLNHKQALKDEIEDMENMLSIKKLPQTLNNLGKEITQQSLNLIKNPNFSSIVLDWIVGLSSKRVISRIAGKKGGYKNIILVISAYCMPWIINKGKSFILDKIHQKQQKITDNRT